MTWSWASSYRKWPHLYPTRILHDLKLSPYGLKVHSYEYRMDIPYGSKMTPHKAPHKTHMDHKWPHIDPPRMEQDPTFIRHGSYMTINWTQMDWKWPRMNTTWMFHMDEKWALMKLHISLTRITNDLILSLLVSKMTTPLSDTDFTWP